MQVELPNPEITSDQHSLGASSRRRFIANLEPSRRGFVTNYPNFQHWKKTLPSQVNLISPLNIYVHIPFCAQQCSYCYYRTVTGSRKSEMDRYVDALCKEIERSSEHFSLRERPISSIYFGGGTPTLLDEQSLNKITETLHKCFKLDSNNLPEFTVEGEPVTVIKKKTAVLQKIGANRISMGVQSLCDDVLKRSNRQDTENKVIRAIGFAQETGAVVNIDLMSGLAGETMNTWKYSVKRALEIGVESITVYKTELYANTQYFKDLRNEKIILPTDEEEIELMRYAIAQFEEASYLPWCFFTFTKEGKYQHVHATRIWEGEDYFPFGVSAFGRLGTQLFQNTNDVSNYVEQVEKGEIPIFRGHRMTALDEIVRDVLLGIKLNYLSFEYFRDKYGFNLETLCGSAIDELAQKGYVKLTDSRLVLTPEGMVQGDYSGKFLARALLERYAA
ncbi:MAG: radical SAM family heme chaperone HemW [Thioploca sp.]|nr:radical SAM family heme chaperone HemW [Thioploca sp.]